MVPDSVCRFMTCTGIAKVQYDRTVSVHGYCYCKTVSGFPSARYDDTLAMLDAEIASLTG